MNLVGLSKIKAVIDRIPEADTPYKLWLKEIGLKNNLFDKRAIQYDNFIMVSYPGTGKFAVKFKFRLSTSAGYIEWAGTKGELISLENEQRQKSLEQKPDSQLVKIVSVVKAIPEIFSDEYIKTEETANESEIKLQVPQNVNTANYADFTNEVEYINGLQQFESLFDEGPSADNQALFLLLQQIKSYEEQNIDLSKLSYKDAIHYRMKEFDLSVEQLASTLKAGENLDLFFKHQQDLSTDTKEKLMKILGIKLALDDFS
ncbi:MAG: hypothetical protein JKY70_14265 [Mucilaginibacter sp.]|nr:hypothetical protein [Mucilaginibacter sp.]